MKKKIEATEKHDPSWQKLIFAGKILNDEAKVSDYNINENAFLVLMVRKVKENGCHFALRINHYFSLLKNLCPQR